MASGDFAVRLKVPPLDESSVAWTGGVRYATTADIEKIVGGAREEQVADTIKRIFDCANHPREEHLPTAERLICSQGLFWLAEIADRNDVPEWISYTRLFAEVAAKQEESEPAIVISRSPVSDRVVEIMRRSFLTIPAGRYVFGSTDVSVDSEPPASCFDGNLEEFEILRCPVTNELWNAMVETPAANGKAESPVTNVTYFEARRFAEIVQERLEVPDDRRVRLPTEYQWEAAARGMDGRCYPWGNEFEITRCNCEMRVGRTTGVGMYSPQGDSPFGCQDMAGNVREWTRSYAGTRGIDWSLHSQARLLEDGGGIRPASRVIIRGGSYSYASECVQAWVRNTQIAARRDCQTGFRLVREATRGRPGA